MTSTYVLARRISSSNYSNIAMRCNVLATTTSCIEANVYTDLFSPASLGSRTTYPCFVSLLKHDSILNFFVLPLRYLKSLPNESAICNHISSALKGSPLAYNVNVMHLKKNPFCILGKSIANRGGWEWGWGWVGLCEL